MRDPWLHRQAGLSPTAGYRRRHWRRADGPSCARAVPTPPAAPPTSCVRRWGGCATPGPGDNSRCGPTAASTLIAWYPSAARWMSASPSQSTKASTMSSRPYLKMPGRRFPTGWTAPPMWQRPPISPSRVSPTPRGAAHRPACEAHARFPVGPLRHLQVSLHHRPRWGDAGTGGRPSPPHLEIENAIRDLKYGVGQKTSPSGRFAANGAWLAVQVIAHNLARWTARIGLGEQLVTTKTLRRRVFSLAGRVTRSARRLTLHLPQCWPLGNPVQSSPGPTASHSTPSLTASMPLTQRPRQLAPTRSAGVP